MRPLRRLRSWSGHRASQALRRAPEWQPQLGPAPRAHRSKLSLGRKLIGPRFDRERGSAVFVEDLARMPSDTERARVKLRPIEISVHVRLSDGVVALRLRRRRRAGYDAAAAAVGDERAVVAQSKRGHAEVATLLRVSLALISGAAPGCEKFLLHLAVV